MTAEAFTAALRVELFRLDREVSVLSAKRASVAGLLALYETPTSAGPSTADSLPPDHPTPREGPTRAGEPEPEICETGEKYSDPIPWPVPFIPPAEMVGAGMVVPVPKLMPLRDEEYRRLVATLKCVMCNVVGFSNACHSDDSSKGAGLKSGDETCYPACVSRPGILGCHERIGTVREIPKNQRHELEELWANQTRMTLRKLAMFDNGARRIVERAIGL